MEKWRESEIRMEIANQGEQMKIKESFVVADFIHTHKHTQPYSQRKSKKSRAKNEVQNK